MASLCGFFGLAIFPYLFYYAEAVRRQVVDEALSLSSNESLELRQVSSELLELRDARTDAKLVRSHDASLFFKKGGGGKETKSTGPDLCDVKVGNEIIVIENLSAPCCKDSWAWVCSEFKTYKENWTHPSCDKLNSKPRDETACSNEADKAILGDKHGRVKSTMEEEFEKLMPECRVRMLSNEDRNQASCRFGHIPERCCEENQAFMCSVLEGYDVNISYYIRSKEKDRSCDELSNKAPDRSACLDPSLDRGCIVDMWDQLRRSGPPTTGCRVKVADTTCNLGALSAPCCQDQLALVCSEFEYDNISWKSPFCDISSVKEPHGTVCSNEADEKALAKTTCLKDAISREKAKLVAE